MLLYWFLYPKAASIFFCINVDYIMTDFHIFSSLTSSQFSIFQFSIFQFSIFLWHINQIGPLSSIPSPATLQKLGAWITPGDSLEAGVLHVCGFLQADKPTENWRQKWAIRRKGHHKGRGFLLGNMFEKNYAVHMLEQNRCPGCLRW